MKVYLSVSGVLLTAVLLLLAGLLVLCCLLAPFTQTIVADCLPNVKEENGIFAAASTRPTVILDPGHGGEDSGAVGVDGVLEKDLNLSMARRLYDLLTFEGWQVILTRREDVLLYSSDLSLSHKSQDLKNRLDYSARYPRAIFVSIHMNKFPAESCKGLQIYYSPNHPDSRSMALELQTAIQKKLTPENHREIKSATSSIYILHRIQIPAILIECGFISNREESQLLRNGDYQKKMIAIFVAGLAQFSDWQGEGQRQRQPSA